MDGLTEVAVSLATYKAIEAQRLSFSESHDSIIRRALAERTMKRRRTPVLLSARGAPRRRGRVAVALFGREQPVLNLRDAYLAALTGLARHTPVLFERMAEQGSPRRRWAARSAEALYVTAPHLAAQFAHQITPDWFVDTNLSRAQIVARMETATRLAGYRFGEDVVLVEA
ncbi:MAG: hypothetical protein H0X36_06795 [Sphingomonadaceae bacterium]|nr:hypothetical protein [Sphingomonadaceae bacterium]